MKEQTPLQSKFTSHSITVTDRKKAVFSGISKVESSNATEIALVSCLGNLTVSGSELKTERFDVSTGELAISGNIDSIKYAKAKTPILKRIFK